VRVTPAGMFCTADTPVAVNAVTALLTEMPEYVAARDAVMEAPLVVDSAVDTAAAETVGASDGANTGAAVGAFVIVVVVVPLADGHVVTLKVPLLVVEAVHDDGVHGAPAA